MLNQQIEKEKKEFYDSYGYSPSKENNLLIDVSSPLAGKILEVGCGKGAFSLELAKRGFGVKAVDNSQEDLELAKAEIQASGFGELVDFEVVNAESLPFSDLSFDNVFCVKVLHHLQKPLVVVDELLRVLVEGGKLILSDFTQEGIEMVEKYHAKMGNGHSRTIVTLAEVQRYLLYKGFEIKEFKTKFLKTLVCIRRK